MSYAVVLAGALLLGVVAAGPARAQQVDADAAQALAKRNDCFKCHAIDKTKKAPPYRRIAARLKTKPDAVEVLTASDFRTDLAAASWERGDPVVNLVFECQA